MRCLCDNGIVVPKILMRTSKCDDSMANGCGRMRLLENQASPLASVKEPRELVNGMGAEIVEVAPASIILESICHGDRGCYYDDPFAIVLITFTFPTRACTLFALRSSFVALNPSDPFTAQER